MNPAHVFPKIPSVDIPIAMTAYLKSLLHLQLMRLHLFIDLFTVYATQRKPAVRLKIKALVCHQNTDLIVS